VFFLFLILEGIVILKPNPDYVTEAAIEEIEAAAAVGGGGVDSSSSSINGLGVFQHGTVHCR